jgi:hypothetical protein
MNTLYHYRWLLVIWALFIVRGIFYCSVWPLWEGWDEWAHFGVVQEMSTTGHALIDRSTPLSKEINASLELAPLPRGMTAIPLKGVTREAYWKLPLGERLRREEALQQLPIDWADQHAPDGLPAYEASQPPLSYWLMAVPLHAMRYLPLVDRVWSVRLITFAFGSLGVPIGFILALRVFENEAVAMGLTALVAVLPGTALSLAHVSNESLGIVVFTVLFLITCAWIDQPQTYSRTIATGVTLGLGLLTKAYFLTAIPALGVTCIWLIVRHRHNRRAQAAHAALVFATAIAIGGWWYLRNYLQTGTISGLDEAMMLRSVGFGQIVDGAFHVNWRAAIDTVLLSHLWNAGWSAPSLRTSIYRALYWLLAVAVFGFAVSIRQSRSSKQVCLAIFYAFFWVGLAYQIVMLFLSKSSSTALGGWYLYNTVWAEAILFIAGMFALFPNRLRPALLTALTAGFAGLDLYGAHFVAIPYYAQAKGLKSLDVSRLLINKPHFFGAMSLFCVWVLYLLCTCLIVVAGSRAVLKQRVSTGIVDATSNNLKSLEVGIRDL